MTILQEEMAKRSEIITNVGYLMSAGLVDITPNTESLFQRGLVTMLEVNELVRKQQNEAFEK